MYKHTADHQETLQHPEGDNIDTHEHTSSEETVGIFVARILSQEEIEVQLDKQPYMGD